jgi:predicted phage terminase large subunit-like protein
MPDTITLNQDRVQELLKNPLAIQRELNNRSLYEFLQYFWPVVSAHKFSPNWHIEKICGELEQIAERVGNRQPKLYDLLINQPPGTTKTITVSIIFPAWCWTRWYWMRFICASYSNQLSLESAGYCRDLIKSQQFQEMYPEIGIKEDKDVKSNFKIVKKTVGAGGPHRSSKEQSGGGRYSTSVGGTLTGFHGDINIWDDALNPSQAASDIELANANHWIEQTLSTRKTDKDISVTIGVMQRLAQGDCSGYLLDKQKDNLRHICLPGEIRNYRDFLLPAEWASYYKDDLLDPARLSWAALTELEADLGQYGYAGQIGQNPTPPGGGMFKVDKIKIEPSLPAQNLIEHTVRAGDKAGTANAGDFTVGVKMSRLLGNKWFISDMVRGRWSTNEREQVIRNTAEKDGTNVEIWQEQEGGSGGKESAEATIRNLAGFKVYSERPTGDKTFRADPFSVQVNNGGVSMLLGAFNSELLEELRYFPFGNHDDIVDACGLSFNKLTAKKIARRIV